MNCLFINVFSKLFMVWSTVLQIYFLYYLTKYKSTHTHVQSCLPYLNICQSLGLIFQLVVTAY